MLHLFFLLHLKVTFSYQCFWHLFSFRTMLQTMYKTKFQSLCFLTVNLVAAFQSSCTSYVPSHFISLSYLYNCQLKTLKVVGFLWCTQVSTSVYWHNNLTPKGILLSLTHSHTSRFLLWVWMMNGSLHILRRSPWGKEQSTHNYYFLWPTKKSNKKISS